MLSGQKKISKKCPTSTKTQVCLVFHGDLSNGPNTDAFVFPANQVHWGIWTRIQRQYSRLNAKGQSTTPLTTERKQLFDEMGFIWHPGNSLGGEKRKQLSGQPAGGASGSLVMVSIKYKDQGERGGDAIVSTPVQRKAHEEYNDKINWLRRVFK